MTSALVSGVLLGLSCGLAPGPLLALVLAQTLRHGPREGCKVALTPLATDVPIIVVALAFASKLAQIRPLFGAVSIAGGVFVLYLAWDSIRAQRLDTEHVAERPMSWLKGILTNLLSPHPWLFWLTVGAASLANALTKSMGAAAAFLAGFYLFLVGSKMLVAWLAGKSRHLLIGRPYRVLLIALGCLLATFAILLLADGVRNLGLL